jgi:hypothetical protein
VIGEKKMKYGDLIDRQAAIDALHMHLMYRMGTDSNKKRLDEWINNLPSAQPDIKQAAKLLLDFIESCPGGDSYLITPNGEELRTDWGYAMEGIQLIHDWAERRTDGSD